MRAAGAVPARPPARWRATPPPRRPRPSTWPCPLHAGPAPPPWLGSRTQAQASPPEGPLRRAHGPSSSLPLLDSTVASGGTGVIRAGKFLLVLPGHPPAGSEHEAKVTSRGWRTSAFSRPALAMSPSLGPSAEAARRPYVHSAAGGGRGRSDQLRPRTQCPACDPADSGCRPPAHIP